MKKYLMIGILASLCLLSGCVRLQTPTASTTFQIEKPAIRQAQLAKVNSWKINGAFSIQQTGQQPEIANYSWYQFANKNYRIEISSVLNLYSVVIDCDANSITLSKNGTQKLSAKTPEKLMLKALGWSLPIDELHEWIKGMPALGKYSAQYDAYGHLILLKQKGWTVKYDSYKANAAVDLPQMITLRRSGLFVKIVINQFDSA
ncbi:MAG: lipoprotein insertase outer membrane protein LolB [Gammaproteobacteria bacterium]|nr:lipoprotein insertase outer membrane protein LolB [Gammaproteobacteria bacterium]